MRQQCRQRSVITHFTYSTGNTNATLFSTSLIDLRRRFIAWWSSRWFCLFSRHNSTDSYRLFPEILSPHRDLCSKFFDGSLSDACRAVVSVRRRFTQLFFSILLYPEMQVSESFFPVVIWFMHLVEIFKAFFNRSIRFFPTTPHKSVGSFSVFLPVNPGWNPW